MSRTSALRENSRGFGVVGAVGEHGQLVDIIIEPRGAREQEQFAHLHERGDRHRKRGRHELQIQTALSSVISTWNASDGILRALQTPATTGAARRSACGSVTYIVGCNHGIQPNGPLAKLDGADAQKQRAHFAALLESILKQAKIQLVGEEWGGGEPTIAENLARNYDVPYRDINTSRTDLEQMEIPCDYVKGPYTNQRKEQWHRHREQFMLEKIREFRGAAQNVLIVCGFTHLEQLSGLLQQEDATVEVVDYRKLAWYRPGVFPEDP